jgi:hypothetical protein
MEDCEQITSGISNNCRLYLDLGRAKNNVVTYNPSAAISAALPQHIYAITIVNTASAAA